MRDSLPEPLPELLPELRLELPHFSGNLEGIALALRAGTLVPADVPLYNLAKQALERFQILRRLDPERAAEALPQMAVVVLLKTRLLLPKTPIADLEEEEVGFDPLEEVLESVSRLAELEGWVTFLSQRRSERQNIVAAPPLELTLPRRERDEKSRKRGLLRLLEVARQTVREVKLEDLVRDRTTLTDAYQILISFANRLKRFFFSKITVTDWAERTVYFTALLEGIKVGQLEGHQEQPYSDIEISTEISTEVSEMSQP
jgi:segregation and condensation protein A